MTEEPENPQDVVGPSPAQVESPADDTDPRTHAYKVALAMAIALLAVATIVYRFLEDWSWVDAFYFSSVAVTTVGFGDLSPTTDVTKLFTVFYIFAGIGLIGVVLNEMLRRRALRSHDRRSRRRN